MSWLDDHIEIRLVGRSSWLLLLTLVLQIAACGFLVGWLVRQ